MPTVRFQSGAEGSQSFVRENGGSFIITLTLSQPSSDPVTVVVRPFPSGVDAADMDLRDYTVTFAPGATSATYRAQIYNDSVDEPDENVVFEIVSATNATIDLSTTDAFRIIGRILDDDLPEGPTVRFISGAQGSQSFVGEGAGFFTITLTLSQAATVPVTVVVRPLASAVDGADMDLGDHSVTFAPGETTATYRAQIFDDAIDEPDENVFFELVSVTNATIDLSSTDAYRILGRILDNDVPAGPTVRFMAGAQGSQSFVSEGAGSFAITLVLSQPSSVPVTLVVRPFASAVDSQDMDLRDVTITFAPGETSAIYHARVYDDATDETDENVIFEIVSVTNATIDVSSLDAYHLLGRILDDDAPAMTGTAAADALSGSALSETINGLDGDDRIDGGGGNDLILGGDGDDFISGGGGADRIEGGLGNDTLIGGPGNNSMAGGDGLDTAILPSLFRSYASVDLHDAAGLLAGGPESGTDSLDSVEYIRFQDGVFQFDAEGAAAQIMRLYDAALQRLPDEFGLDYWTDRMEDGGETIGQIALQFLNSNEFQGRTEQLGDADFVEFLYRNALHRPSDPAGKSYWLDRLLSGATDRADLLVAFSESAEHHSLTAALVAQGFFNTDDDYQTVAMLYDSFAGRLPDASGLIYWAEALRSGAMTLDQVGDAFADSAEFRSATENMSNGELIEFLYHNTLERHSDPDGLAFYLARLNGGMDRGDLLIDFSQSAEHFALMGNSITRGIDYL